MDKIIVCIDLGGTSVKAGICSFDGKLSEQCSFPVPDEFEALAGEIVRFTDRMREKYDVAGLAVSAPGAVDVDKGIIGGGSAIPYIHGPSWTEVFSGLLNMPVSIENDANCAALAEIVFGNGRGYRDMAFVVCGTGIGGALVSDGKVRHGAHLYSGEFGCMVMRDEEGSLSTFSAQASTMSFVRKVRSQYPDEEWDGRKVFDRAKEGDTVCIQAIDRFYSNLAEGIYNVQHVYDPEIILLGGGISSREDFIPQLKEKLEATAASVDEKFATHTIRPLIDVCAFRDGANLIGAAADWLQRYGGNG